MGVGRGDKIHIEMCFIVCNEGPRNLADSLAQDSKISLTFRRWA